MLDRKIDKEGRRRVDVPRTGLVPLLLQGHPRRKGEGQAGRDVHRPAQHVGRHRIRIGDDADRHLVDLRPTQEVPVEGTIDEMHARLLLGEDVRASGHV